MTDTPENNVLAVHVVSLDGLATTASFTIPQNGWNDRLRTVGSHLYFVDGGTLERVDAHGSVTPVLTLQTPGVNSNPDPGALGFVVSPDESQVLYAYPVSMTQGSGGQSNSYESRIYIAQMNGTPRLLLDDVNDPYGFASPFAWTPDALWMLRLPSGLGGAGPFLDYSTIQASTLDIATASLSAPSTCGMTDYLAVDEHGGYICARHNTSGQATSATSFAVHTAGGGLISVPWCAALQASGIYIGATRLSPDETSLVVGMATFPASTCPTYTGFAVVQIPSGACTVIADGMEPVAWAEGAAVLVTAERSNHAVQLVDTATQTPQPDPVDGDSSAIGILTTAG